MTIGIVVADDHEVVRAGFAAILDTQPDFTVLGIAADGAEAVRTCQERRPDVVLMDVRMPGMDGIEATRLIAGGLSNPEIAKRLVVTEETVKTHVSRVLSKLGLRDRTQAVVAAYESGLVVPGTGER
jgi:DNA-binding NarL/FixJ family response regulator